MTSVSANPSTERLLLGELLLHPDRIADAREGLRLDDFDAPAHRGVFRALLALDSEGLGVDPVTVTEWLELDSEHCGRAPTDGWKRFVFDIMGQGISGSMVPQRCRTLADRSTLRELRNALQESIKDAKAAHPGVGTGVADTLDRIEERIHMAGERRLAGSEIVEVAELSPAVLEQLERGDAVPALDTGIPDVDRILCGLRSGELILVAARPTVGKTTLALQIALNASAGGASVLVLSLEMSPRELTERMQGNLGNVPSTSIRSGRLDDAERKRLADADEELRSRRIGFVEGNATTIQRLRGHARRFARRAGLHLIVVDYVQLMSDPGRKERVQEVGAISRGLKGIAREFNVPVLAVSQLSRGGDGERPQLKHLRDSGELEQDADAVVMLWSEQKDGPLSCYVEKNRHGPTGEVRLAFLREYFKIAGLSRGTETKSGVA